MMDSMNSIDVPTSDEQPPAAESEQSHTPQQPQPSSGSPAENPLMTEFREAVLQCQREVLQSDERFVCGWVILSINQFDHEQERVLILSDKAIVRVKYIFTKSKVEHFNRTELQDVSRIEMGWLVDNKMSVNTLAKTVGVNQVLKMGTPHFGFRIHTNAPPTKVWNKEQPFATYRAWVSPTVGNVPSHQEAAARLAKQEMETKAAEQIVSTIANSGKEALADFEVMETNVSRGNNYDFTFGIHNASRLGMKGKKAFM